MIKMLLLSAIALSIFTKQTWALNVTYVTNTNSSTPFWEKTFAVANAAAKDLGITMTFVQGTGHRIYQARIIANISQQEVKPDLLIFTGHPQNALASFTLLEAAKIPFITLSNFKDDQSLPVVKQLGSPQQRFKYWLAEDYNIQRQGSTLLIKTLLSRAKTTLSNTDELKVLALSGDFFSYSIQRSLALASYLEQSNEAVLVQDIIAYWQAEDAKAKFKALYKRHKGIEVVWSSSDVMAIGALAGAKELGLVPNKDIFIGGFDWDDSAIKSIRDKQLSASVGGHYYSIAWLLVKIYDHFNGLLPFNDPMHSVNDSFAVIDHKNLNEYDAINDMHKLSSVNFYCFSKTYTQNKHYDFSFTNLLKQHSTIKKFSCPE